MTKDDIMKMARDAGAPDPMVFIGAYERFAVAMVAAEREACAKLCESLFDMDDDSCSEAEQCAAAIRARSNK